MTITVAALFADSDGVYSQYPFVDVWDISRDARGYSGPYPVIAHPPCEAWGDLYWTRPGRRRGDDGGCFQSAVDSVEKFGGVLEHPASSSAPGQYGLSKSREWGWHKELFKPGWTCLVEQGFYGHQAPKLTWLYYVGESIPTKLQWGSSGASGTVENSCSKKDRRATPKLFADLLLSMVLPPPCHVGDWLQTKTGDKK